MKQLNIREDSDKLDMNKDAALTQDKNLESDKQEAFEALLGAARSQDDPQDILKEKNKEL
ncbi:MAG: hypothetical protein IJI46_05495 [Erysipelotrichaceae bacterium]|nr:hypothetical protein [Erysipelotrichaceae bacterium]